MIATIPKTSVPAALPKDLLPSASSTDIILSPANPLEYTQTWHLNAKEWQGPLSLDQYLSREHTLQNLDLTKDGHITAWILTSERLPLNPDGSRPILACCESLLKHAYLVRDGKMQRILAHGLGSVYCRPEYRGLGYAGRMMIELGKAMETWQQPNGAKGIFSVLYSDIGNKFYSQRGWKAFPSTHVHLLPVDQETYSQLAKKSALPVVEDIQEEDVSKMPVVPQFEEELVQASKNRPQIPHVAIRPDMAHMRWHFAREEIQAQALEVEGGFPLIKGAVHTPTGTAMIWSRVYAFEPEENQLHILRTVIDPSRSADEPEIQAALAALLLRSQLEANVWNMQNGVEIWSPSEAIVRAAQSLREAEGKKDRIEIVSRDKEHVCSLKWIGGPSDEEVIWVGNEKYAWC